MELGAGKWVWRRDETQAPRRASPRCQPLCARCLTDGRGGVVGLLLTREAQIAHVMRRSRGTAGGDLRGVWGVTCKEKPAEAWAQPTTCRDRAGQVPCWRVSSPQERDQCALIQRGLSGLQDGGW